MKNENFVKGIIGGVIGSLVGVIAILIFYKLGYIAAVAGLLMSVCTINLYQKFAGGISKKGVVACIIIMIVMTIVGNNLAFSFSVVEELKEYYAIDSDVTYVFFNLFSLMSEGVINISSYVLDLSMIVLFNVAGAVGILKNQFKKIKVSNHANNVNVPNGQMYQNNINPQNNLNYNCSNMNNNSNYNNGYMNNNSNYNNGDMNNNNSNYNNGYMNNNTVNYNNNNGINQMNNNTNQSNFNSTDVNNYRLNQNNQNNPNNNNMM